MGAIAKEVERSAKELTKQAFGERVRACQTKLYRVSVAIMENYADAEDAASEAVMKAWEKRESLREEAYFETWLIRILINTCRESLRRKKAHPLVELTDAAPASEAQGYEDLHAALKRVEEKYRLPFVMHAAMGMTVDAVAQALKLPRGVAKWRIEKGRKITRMEMEREEGER